MSDLTEVYDGTHQTPKYTDSGIMFLSVENIKTLQSVKYISEEAFKAEFKVFPEKGDVLMTRIGDIGTANVFELNEPTAYYVSLALLKCKELDPYFLKESIYSETVKKDLWHRTLHIAFPKKINKNEIEKVLIPYPKSRLEQEQIGAFFRNLNNLITLHQRKPFLQKKEVNSMRNEFYSVEIFCNYYAKWIDVYKNGAVRKVTMEKYLMTHRWLIRLVPNLRTEELDRIQYQQLLNKYAEYHEKQTVMDFHHQLKGAILDAVDEGLIERDPTRKAIIKGKSPRVKKIKYLNQFQLQILISSLELEEKISWDYFILLIAKTGMRFSEALALTPADFDLRHQSVSISKTWDYKGNGGFLPTKNRSSVRKLQIDWQTVIQFSELIKRLPQDKPIFVDGKIYNSTVNNKVVRLCKQCKIPVISIHGLRHTHASLLLFTGVSIASVARRLGHSSINTTQKTYLHIIQELENKDVDLVMRLLAGLS